MLFKGISRVFSLKNEDQYNTIGQFYDECEAIYGLEALVGLGYRWHGGNIYYAIGLCDGVIDGANFEMELPDDGWTLAIGMTETLKKMYDEIYRDGALKLELERFYNDGHCEIRYLR